MRRPARPFVIVGLVLVLPVLVAMRPAEAPQMASRGQEIFVKNCKRCHGADGTKGFLGAKDLSASRLADDPLQRTILNGRRVMPAFRKKLTAEDLAQVMLYVKGLRR